MSAYFHDDELLILVVLGSSSAPWRSTPADIRADTEEGLVLGCKGTR